MRFHRRTFLKACPFAALATALFAKIAPLLAEIPHSTLLLETAVYRYNHVKLLIDGSFGSKGCEANCSVAKIGNLNNHVFAGPQTRGVTEIGLAPYKVMTLGRRTWSSSIITGKFTNSTAEANAYV